MYKKSITTIKALFIGVITVLALFAGSTPIIAEFLPAIDTVPRQCDFEIRDEPVECLRDGALQVGGPGLPRLSVGPVEQGGGNLLRCEA